MPSAMLRWTSTPKVAMPVDLFGQAADFARLEPVCRKYGLKKARKAPQFSKR